MHIMRLVHGKRRSSAKRVLSIGPPRRLRARLRPRREWHRLLLSASPTLSTRAGRRGSEHQPRPARDDARAMERGPLAAVQGPLPGGARPQDSVHARGLVHLIQTSWQPIRYLYLLFTRRL